MITLFAVIRKYSLRGQFKTDICKQIYANGVDSIVTQSLYTLYIVELNMILKTFTEDAVTVLEIYYKIQSFFLSLCLDSSRYYCHCSVITMERVRSAETGRF